MNKQIIKRISLIAVVLLSIFSCKQQETRLDKVKASKPNIIFILADDLGYGDLGCYGQKDILTPNIDKLAARGMRFTQHYAGATVCAPSRNCLMTGQHNGHAFIKSMEKPIPAKDITVAEVLKGAGYKTALIGKWGLGNVGTTGYANAQGFDYSFGYYDQIRAHNYYTDYLMENGEKYPLKNKVIYIDDSTHYANGIGNAATEKVEYSNDVFAEKALEIIDNKGEEPLFMYLAFTIPHANNESWLIKQHGMEVPELGVYENKDWSDVKKAGAAMITRLDSYVGQIVNKLKEKGLDENTIILFSSDNGPHGEGGWNPGFFNSNGGLRGMKRDLYEGGIRVPLIVSWSNKITPGISDHVAAFWDFMPTACDLAGVDLPETSDGLSFLPTLMDEPTEQLEHKYMYWEFYAGLPRQAVRKGDWKLVRLGKGKPHERALELYNLANDKKEENNLADKHPELVKELAEVMDNYPRVQ